MLKKIFPSLTRITTKPISIKDCQINKFHFSQVKRLIIIISEPIIRLIPYEVNRQYYVFRVDFALRYYVLKILNFNILNVSSSNCNFSVLRSDIFDAVFISRMLVSNPCASHSLSGNSK